MVKPEILVRLMMEAPELGDWAALALERSGRKAAVTNQTDVTLVL